jgi:hypothetical protein
VSYFRDSSTAKNTQDPPIFLPPNGQLPGGSGEKAKKPGEMINRKLVPEVVVREPQSDETAKKNKKTNKTTLRERKRKNSIMVIEKTTKKFPIFFCILVYMYMYTAIPLSNIFF